MSLNPARSPRLKLPFPCLNSHSCASGEPVWKTSLTVGCCQKSALTQELHCFVPLWKPYMFNWRTKDEILVCLKYCLQMSAYDHRASNGDAYARTFEKSLDGDMRKLSSDGDQVMRCDMLGSSNMLHCVSICDLLTPYDLVLVELVYERRLLDLWLLSRSSLRSSG